MARWDDTLYVRVYELARSGMSERDIAAAVGVSGPAFIKWKRAKPALQDALDRARGAAGSPATDTFLDYAYNNLPPHLQGLWDEINGMVRDNDPDRVRKTEAVICPLGKRGRQQLFIHALVNCNFSASEACRRVNVSKRTYVGWQQDDPDFRELIGQIHEWKKDYFESALVRGVGAGDASLVKFVNQTFNRDRGYAPAAKELKVKGSVKHEHTHTHKLSEEFQKYIAELSLPLRVLSVVLEHAKARDERAKRQEESRLLADRSTPTTTSEELADGHQEDGEV